MKYKILNKFCVLSAAALISVTCLTGCVKDDTAVTPVPGSGEVPVQFSIVVPMASAPKTRALSDGQEESIETIDILAFDGDADNAELLYHLSVPKEELIPAGNKMSFTYNLSKSNTPVRFVLLANSKQIINECFYKGFVEGNYNEIRSKLISTSSGAWNTGNPYTPLPMWGEHITAVTSPTQLNVDMLRVQARIDVLCKAPDFVMEEVYLIYPMDKGLVIPHKENYSQGKVSSPSLGSDWRWSVQRQEYSVEPGSGSEGINQQCKNQIYTYEFNPPSPEEGARIVVGGRRNIGDPVTYYRIDFAVEKENIPNQYDYIPVLRNHSYKFTITSIEYDGAETPMEAAYLKAINTVELTVEDDHKLKHYIYDDQYFLGVETTEITFNWFGTSTYEFGIKTDYPGGWFAQFIDRPYNYMTFPPGALSFQGSVADNAAKIQSKNGLGMSSSRPDKMGYPTATIRVTAGTINGHFDITLKPVPVSEMFASSNIFLDANGNLNFATSEEEMETLAKSNYQGLMFRWGSLIGINHDAENSGEAWHESHVVFVPEGYKGITDWSDYHNIPGMIHNREDDRETTRTDYFEEYPNRFGPGYVIEEGTGDICRYLSNQPYFKGRGKWRMPEEGHIKLLISEHSNPAPWMTNPSSFVHQSMINNPSKGKGTAPVNSGMWIGNNYTTNLEMPEGGTIFLPASGERDENTGAQINHGIIGSYWTTGCKYRGNAVQPLIGEGRYYSFTNGSKIDFQYGSAFQALPVRCVRISDNND